MRILNGGPCSGIIGSTLESHSQRPLCLGCGRGQRAWKVGHDALAKRGRTTISVMSSRVTIAPLKGVTGLLLRGLGLMYGRFIADITKRTVYRCFHKLGGPFRGCPSKQNAFIWGSDFAALIFANSWMVYLPLIRILCVTVIGWGP